MFAIERLGGPAFVYRRQPERQLVAVMVALIVSLMGLLAVSPALHAESTCSDTWTGGSSGEWQASSNWSANRAPNRGDVACIAAGDTVEWKEQAGGNFGPEAAEIQGAGARLVVNFAGLYLEGSGTSTLGRLEFDSPVQGEGDQGEVNGRLNITESLLATREGNFGRTGVVAILPGATASFSTHWTIFHGTFLNEGTTTLAGEGALILGEHGLIENKGTFVANTEGTAIEVETPEREQSIINEGRFQKTSGSGTTTIAPLFENYGTIDEQNGHLHFNNLKTFAPGVHRGAKRDLNYPTENKPTCGDPVDCATGNFYAQQTDLNVQGGEVPLALTRTYNSQAAAEGLKGLFGYGWTSCFSDHLVINKAKKEVILEDAEGADVPFAETSTGSFKGPYPSPDLLTGSSEAGYTVTLENQLRYHFSGTSGRLEYVLDRHNNTTSLTYNTESGQLETIAGPFGRSIKLAYNSEGFVERATDPMGHIVKYTYEHEDLATVTMPAEEKPRWTFRVDGSHEITEMINNLGGVTANAYNATHQVTSQTSPLKRTLSFEYLGSETRITDHASGAVTLETFTGFDEPASVTKGYGTSLATTTIWKYSRSGGPIEMTDGDGHTTTYEYDGEGNRVADRTPEGHESKWEYDHAHDIVSETSPLGERTTIERNASGDPLTVNRPAPHGATQRYQYKWSPKGELEAYTDPLEHTWTYEYDSHRDRTAESDPEGDKRRWTYDEDGYVVSTVSPRGVAVKKESNFTTKIERDNQERIKTETNPLKDTTKYTYDGDGNVETITDALGDTTTYGYNSEDEMTKAKEPSGIVVETEYDVDRLAVAETNGNKQTTKYVRNILGQVSELIDSRGRPTTKEYNGDGNLIKLTDPAKRTKIYRYNEDDKLVEVTYSDGKTHSVSYEYNGLGDRTRMVDGSGTSTYEYDQLDRLAAATDGHGDSVAFEYNLNNAPTHITYPTGKNVTREYDKDERLKSVNDWAGHTTQFSYDADSDLTATLPTSTGDKDTYAYDDADKMSEVVMSSGAETLASLVYARSKDGYVTSATTTGLPGEAKPAFSYEKDSRLSKGAGTTYKYDEANNPIGIGSATYTYDSADELESSSENKAIVANYAYNEVGERIKTEPAKGPTTSYGYDQAGNLISVERPKEGEVAEINDSYGYNGDGLRVSQDISGSTSYLSWDTQTELPLILSDERYSYIYGPEDIPIEQINTSTGAVQYLHHDQAGSTRLITGSTGAVEGKCTYRAYGTPTCEGTATTSLGFDSQYTSSDTGLIYMRARNYDPTTAQFLSVDPAVSVTRAPYNYAGDDPVNNADPTGRSSEGLGEGVPCYFPFCAPPPSATEGAEQLGKGIVEGGREVAEGIAHGAESIWNAVGGEGAERNPAQDKKLTDQEIEALKKGGSHPHELKPGGSSEDLYRDREGNVYTKPNDGSGPGEETGLNMKDFGC